MHSKRAAERSRLTASACLAVLSLGACLGCAPQPTATSTGAAANETGQATTEIQAQKAVAGVGKQGQSLRDDSGVAKILSGPAAAYFDVKQKAVLEIQVPQALQLYKATHGEFPDSHDEFMKQIVEANRLVLPELPEGAKYQFKSDLGELWVVPIEAAP